jgi:hypothetical protein
MKFYYILFSHYVTGKTVVESEDQLLSKINRYLEEQNKGEARSDRLKMISFKEVTIEEYNRLFVTGSLNTKVLG